MDLRAYISAEIKPALGCTETGAVALAAAVAAKHLGKPPESIQLRLSSNLYKNGKNVGIPGAPGLAGNLYAGALGGLAGDPDKGLQSLQGVTQQDIEAARKLIEAGMVTQEIVRDVPEVYAEADLSSAGDTVTAVIAQRHDHVAQVLRNGETVFEDQGASASVRPKYLNDLVKLDMEGLWELAGQTDPATERHLLDGARMNLEAAEAGLAKPWANGAAPVLASMAPQGDLLWKIKAWSAGASELRMGGGSLPIMASAGSGNHGVTVIIPPALAAQEWGATDEELAQSLLLGHLVTGYIKAFTGRLTPVCGCAVAAGAGAAAALVRLGKGTPRQAEHAVATLLGALLGMVCDGAKGTCALKVSAAAGEAYLAAKLALAGGGVTQDQGVLPIQLHKMAENVAAISSMGLTTMDSAILLLMQDMDADHT